MPAKSKTRPAPKASPAQEKLSAVRARMAHHGLDVYYVPSVDEHINEYLPVENQRRQFLTGFSGSAGDALIACQEAWVFADSRYYEQADYEVDRALFRVSKIGMEGHPNVAQAVLEMARKYPNKSYVFGFDPFTMTVQQYRQFEQTFRLTNVQLKPVTENLIDTVWVDDRPEPVNAAVYVVPVKYTGLSAKQKLAQVRKAMAAKKIDVLPITKLDQIAWLFNLRGNDIAYNPLFIAYAVITPNEAFLLTETSRFPAAICKNLKTLLQFKPYGEYAATLRTRLGSGQRILIDTKHTTMGTLNTARSCKATVVEVDHPVELLKAIKNKTEIHWMQQAHLKSGRAKTRALYWLEKQIKAKKTVTEKSFADQLEQFYKEEPDYVGLSFNTISGAGANSSIVHYGTPSGSKKLAAGQLFLVDSGVQYMGGTTDDTRTMIVGKPTALHKQRYTTVLKAHIACAAQVFPKGTDGIRLDAITRSALWNLGLDYGHGTGHGVGAFLNVHEGPNGIHRQAKTPLMPGMVTSIEPGYYEPGWGGIRLENLYVCIEKQKGWFGFETLTYIPFDKNLINFSILTTAEKTWLKKYHAAVLRKISKTLSKPEQAWLKRYCAL